MVVIGHEFIDSEVLYKICEISEIEKTPSNSTIYLNWSEENIKLIKFANKNSVNFAIKVNGIKELVFANSFGAKYIVVSNLEFAKIAQKIAENYLFDAKILLEIETDLELEEAILALIDGVIYKKVVVNG